MTQLLTNVERHVLKHAGAGDWAEVPESYWSEYVAPIRKGQGRWVPYAGLRPAVRRLVKLGYIHARTATFSPIGRYSDRRLAPEPYPDFRLVQTQAVLTAQGQDLAKLVFDR